MNQSTWDTLSVLAKLFDATNGNLVITDSLSGNTLVPEFLDLDGQPAAPELWYAGNSHFDFDAFDIIDVACSYVEGTEIIITVYRKSGTVMAFHYLLEWLDSENSSHCFSVMSTLMNYMEAVESNIQNDKNFKKYFVVSAY